MKKEKQAIHSKRRYRMGVRAEAAEETRRRIMEAVIGLHMERYYDQISLDDVADRAGVTVQTVLRRFGSKDQLIDAASQRYSQRLSPLVECGWRWRLQDIGPLGAKR